MPFGPEAGNVHDTGFVDAAVVAVEVAIVVLCALALVTPTAAHASARRTSRAGAAACVVIPLCALALATAALVSPSSSDHAHIEGGDEAAHDHAAPVDSGQAALDHDDDADHDHVVTTAATEVAPDEHIDAHADGEAEHNPEDAAASTDVEVAETVAHAHADAAAEATPVDDKGLSLLENGDMAHVYGPDESLDAFTRAALVHQLDLTRSIAERFPTLGDARAAGSRSAGAFGPGMGIHMSMPASGMPDISPPNPFVPSIPGTLTDAEILRPANLLYDGITDDAPLAGFMYYSTSPQEPEGFAGPNDHWHTHGSLCLNMGGETGIEVLRPDEKTVESCEAIGGFFVEQTAFMVHVWTVPGYESNRGVFSDINPAIACPDGTYYTVPEDESEQYQLSKCRSSPA